MTMPGKPTAKSMAPPYVTVRLRLGVEWTSICTAASDLVQRRAASPVASPEKISFGVEAY